MVGGKEARNNQVLVCGLKDSKVEETVSENLGVPCASHMPALMENALPGRDRQGTPGFLLGFYFLSP